MGEVLSFGFNLAVSFPSDSRGSKARIVFVGVLGTGVPRLACLRPVAWLKWWPSTAHLHQRKTQDSREGPSLARRTTRDFLRNGLARQAHEEAERSRQGTLRGARDASHDDRDQVGGRRAPACAVTLFPL